ncbi:MAG: hypothetical protein WDN48_14210 [Pseudolabrys sp.]
MLKNKNPARHVTGGGAGNADLAAERVGIEYRSKSQTRVENYWLFGVGVDGFQHAYGRDRPPGKGWWSPSAEGPYHYTCGPPDGGGGHEQDEQQAMAEREDVDRVIGRKGNWKGPYASGEAHGGNVIDEYIYRDKDGEFYLRVERTTGKQFLQAHWDGKAWKYGAPKGLKLPYYLPQLIKAAPDVPVFICEGEKDADNLTDLKLLAPAPAAARANGPPILTSGSRARRLSMCCKTMTTPAVSTRKRWPRT